MEDEFGIIFDDWYEEIDEDCDWFEDTENMPCDECGYCVGSSCSMFYECYSK